MHCAIVSEWMMTFFLNYGNYLNVYAESKVMIYKCENNYRMDYNNPTKQIIYQNQLTVHEIKLELSSDKKIIYVSSLLRKEKIWSWNIDPQAKEIVCQTEFPGASGGSSIKL